MSNTFKPWGEFSWLLSKLSRQEFSFFGCLSTEDRSTEAFRILKTLNVLNTQKLLEIVDPGDTEEHEVNRGRILDEFNKIKGSAFEVEQLKLLDPISLVVNNVQDFITNSNGKVVLDITCFPKRFFFPLVKILLRSARVDTLIITYSTPESYSTGSLSENPMDWNHIPMFDSDDPDISFDIALVGLGFMPLGLSSLLKDKFSDLDLKLMFPFPPGAPFFQRTWKFIEDMQVTPKIDFKQILRVDALNVSDTFDMIKALSPQGTPILMAPYGPKTMSLAMCLFACITNSPVYYTQPISYDPLYSTGISKCYGYCIKLNGKSLFTAGS